MALNNHQLDLIVSLTSLPKERHKFQQGSSLGEYIDALIDRVRSDFPGELNYLNTRRDDFIRRVGVFLRRKYPHFATEADINHYIEKKAPTRILSRIPSILTSIQYRNGQQPAKRREVAEVMGIRDTSHSTHGSNFSAPQNMKQIIDNLFERVPDSQKASVGQKLKRHYNYDPQTDF